MLNEIYMLVHPSVTFSCSQIIDECSTLPLLLDQDEASELADVVRILLFGNKGGESCTPFQWNHLFFPSWADEFGAVLVYTVRDAIGPRCWRLCVK